MPLLESRVAFQRQQLADLKQQLLEKPDDAALQTRRAAVTKLIHELDLQLASARSARERSEHNQLAATITQLEAEIAELSKGAPDGKAKKRIKQLKKVLEVSRRELNRGMLAGRVLAAKEGLVVLSLGSKDGVTPGWHFNVHRGNQWIARVVVTHVEEGQCTARLDLKRAEPELTPQKNDFVKRAD